MRTRKENQPKDEFDSKLVDISRVVRVAAGGRRLRFRAIIVAGDKAGRVGIGIGKSRDVSKAIERATSVAKKNLIKVPIVKGTIPAETYAKYGPAEVLLRPQTQGRGLVAGSVVRTICSLAGIKNVSSKILGGTTNKLNNSMATMRALENLAKGKTRTKKQEEVPSEKEGHKE